MDRSWSRENKTSSSSLFQLRSSMVSLTRPPSRSGMVPERRLWLRSSYFSSSNLSIFVDNPLWRLFCKRLSTLNFLASETVKGMVSVRPGLEMSMSYSKGESLVKREGRSETEVVPLRRHLKRERVLRKRKPRRGPDRSFASALQHGAVLGPIHFLIVCASQRKDQFQTPNRVVYQSTIVKDYVEQTQDI